MTTSSLKERNRSKGLMHCQHNTKHSACDMFDLEQSNSKGYVGREAILENKIRRKNGWKLCGNHTILMIFLMSFVFMLYQRSLKEDAFQKLIIPENEEPSTSTGAKVLIGIFTTHRRYAEYAGRKEIRELFRSHPHVCDLETAKRNHIVGMDASCKLVYAFVFGGSKDPNAPTSILDATTDRIQIVQMVRPDTSDENSYGDMVYLDIRENMNEGKSFTWLNYASNHLSGQLGADYVGKMDTDTLLYLDRFFEFSSKTMPPSPYNRNTLIGHFLEKRTTWGHDMKPKESDIERRWENVRVYAAGEFYIMSTDLAKSTVRKHAMNPTDIHMEGIEDHDVSTSAFLSVEESDLDSVKLVMMPKAHNVWLHPLKRKHGVKRWEELWRNEQERIQNLTTNMSSPKSPSNLASTLETPMELTDLKKIKNTSTGNPLLTNSTNVNTTSKQPIRTTLSSDDDARAPPMNLPSFIEQNKHLTPSAAEKKNCECGCPTSDVPECPREYSIDDVDKSARVNHEVGALSREISDYMYLELMKRRHQSQIQCLRTVSNSEINDSGGWCLSKSASGTRGTMTLPFPDRPLNIADEHVQANGRFKDNLIEFIRKENMASISDFGAGQGQYGVEILKAFPDSLVYRGYDGAGDVAIFTQNFLSFFDLTIPLNLPVTDWVMSIEVGEHIPSHLEGMVIRNLHAHNCKGIVLSWAKAKQAGHHHINNHSEKYLVDIFSQLGYEKDEEATSQIISGIGPRKHWWLKNTFVLRRKVPVY